MIVVIASELPPAVRGRMKLWFIEPRPNVFVSGIADSVAENVVDYLHQSCPAESGLMVFRSQKQAPGYVISWLGQQRKEIAELTGLQLVIEKEASSQNTTSSR